MKRGPPCIPMVHPVFDRYEGFFEIGFDAEVQATLSLSRRVLRVEDGRTILQNANTSAVDFALAEKTPGRIP